VRALVTATVSALLLAGCATGTPLTARPLLAEGYEAFTPPPRGREVPPPTTETPEPQPVRPGARQAVLAAARALLGKRHIVVDGRSYRDDCTGLIRAVYAQVGIDLVSGAQKGDNGVTAIWRTATRLGRAYDGGRPIEGDLVFFRDTYDLNRDGSLSDGLTHIGLVDEVLPDGTVQVIHRVSRGVVRYRMNLALRDSARDDKGHKVNDTLRGPYPGAPAQLIAQLFASYATLLPVESRFASR